MRVRTVRVSDVLALQRREVVVEPSDEYTEIGVRSFGRGIFHKDPVSGSELGSKRVFRIEPGDLVLSNVFAWEGAIALATEHEAGLIGSHRFMTFTPIDAQVDASWVRWWFLSEPGLERIGQASPGSAGRNRTLAIERFRTLEIPLPPMDVQQQIARRLERVSTASVELTARAQRAGALAEALVVSRSTRPDLSDEGKSSLEWRRVALRDVLEPSGDEYPVDPDYTYRVAGVYSFGRGLIDRGEMKGANTSYRTLTMLRTNDVVFSKLGAWEGASAVVTPEFDGFAVSSEFPVMRLDPDTLDPGFFRAVTRSPDFWAVINSVTRGSMARRKRITPTEYLAASIWLPPITEQKRIAALQLKLDACSLRRTKGNHRIAALLPATMNEAFAGLS